MRIIEAFSHSKTGKAEQNEDCLVVVDNFVAVLDGTTSKSCPTIEGVSGGRFAAQIIKEALENLSADMTALEAVSTISRHLQSSLQQKVTLSEGVDGPSATLLVYNRLRQEIWRVGDSPFMADGVLYENNKRIDDITSAARAVMLEIALANGTLPQDIFTNDVGRNLILPILKQQHLFANREGEYGFGLINGTPVPDCFIEVFSMSNAHEIILASDGYPKLYPNLNESEAYLQTVLNEDPLLFKRHKSTKGLQSGNVSFDDRSYIRFTV